MLVKGGPVGSIMQSRRVREVVPETVAKLIIFQSPKNKQLMM